MLDMQQKETHLDVRYESIAFSSNHSLILVVYLNLDGESVQAVA
jgi:hypothetical protein